MVVLDIVFSSSVVMMMTQQFSSSFIVEVKVKTSLTLFAFSVKEYLGLQSCLVILIDAQYLDYIEAFTALKKWRDRILEFCGVEFSIETFHVDENRDRKISLVGIKKAPEFVSDAFFECGVRSDQAGGNG